MFAPWISAPMAAESGRTPISFVGSALLSNLPVGWTIMGIVYVGRGLQARPDEAHSCAQAGFKAAAFGAICAPGCVDRPGTEPLPHVRQSRLRRPRKRSPFLRCEDRAPGNHRDSLDSAWAGRRRMPHVELRKFR